MVRTISMCLLLLISSPARGAPRPVIVVVDAGHGGTAFGAVGIDGVLEKRVALRAALKLQQALLGQGGVKVVMTRTTDRYLTLSKRVRMANRAGGHLFVSLHCNASSNHKQRGFEAFVLSPRGLEQQARPLARAPLTVEAALRTSQPRRLSLSATLTDLSRRGLRRRAVAFGRVVITGLSRSLGSARNRGLQQARFDVLRGLKMPGVLIEMGFMDHPVEGRQVVTQRYLRRVVHAIGQAVRHYRKRYGLNPRRSSAKTVHSPQVAPNTPQRRRRRDRRRQAPTQHKQPLRKPEVALGAESA
jgi:N-acetylmuramoyl-L-alanine amidase